MSFGKRFAVTGYGDRCAYVVSPVRITTERGIGEIGDAVDHRRARILAPKRLPLFDRCDDLA